MDYSLLVGIHNKPKYWEGIPSLNTGEISPGGTLQSSIEVESFRKQWNKAPSYASQYPSIFVLNDGVEVTEHDEVDSVASALSPDVDLPPSPPISLEPHPPLPPDSMSKLQRSISAPSPRSLITGIVQMSSRRVMTSGASVRMINNNLEDQPARLPAIQKTPVKALAVEHKRGSHSRDHSINSVKITIDTILDSNKEDAKDNETLSSDGGEIHPMDVIISAYENDDQSYLDNEDILSREELKLSPQKYETFQHNKAIITQRMYWPFHRLFTVLGERRLVDTKEFRTRDMLGKGKGKKRKIQLENLSKFVSPISNRKDGGLEMDMSTFSQLPPDKVPNEKIFFVGTIDILQQFNIRKRIEARWRLLQTRSREKPSCVHPQLYADRFIRFFDEYTLGGETPEIVKQRVEAKPDASDDDHDLDYDGIEEISFSKTSGMSEKKEVIKDKNV